MAGPDRLAVMNQIATLMVMSRIYHARGHTNRLPRWLCGRLGHPLWAHPVVRDVKRELDAEYRRLSPRHPGATYLTKRYTGAGSRSR